jgi:tetratricopeptide (TPR) repeat protein
LKIRATELVKINLSKLLIEMHRTFFILVLLPLFALSQKNDSLLLAKFHEKVKQGDNYLAGHNCDSATLRYEEALTIKPNDEYCRDRIAKIKLLHNSSTCDGFKMEYEKYVAKGDACFKAGDCMCAKQYYQQARTFKKDDSYCKAMIDEIEKSLSDGTSPCSGNNEYKKMIAEADKLFASKEWEKAKAKYKDALSLKPNEVYPKEQLMHCEEQLKMQADLDAKYEAAIKKGDEFLKTKDFSSAKNAYREAAVIKPDEVYPKAKMKECDDALAGPPSEKLYHERIAQADALFKMKSWQAAKNAYEEALKLKPNEQYPKDQVAEINNMLSKNDPPEKYYECIAKGDALSKEHKYEEAKKMYEEACRLKPNEQYPKDQITICNDEIAFTEKSYAEAVQQGDLFFKSKKLEDAKKWYQKAAGLKPEEKYPKDKMQEIDNMLSQNDPLNKKYDELIAKGDACFKSGDCYGARTYYQQALSLKSTDTYCKMQLSMMKESLKTGAGPCSQEKEYRSLIEDAGKSFAAKDWRNAKAKYIESGNYDIEGQYSGDQSKKCDEQLKLEVKNSTGTSTYDAALREADSLFAEGRYQEAKAGYQRAHELKPGEVYPLGQQELIDKILADLEYQYGSIIKAADNYFFNKRLYDAKKLYLKALEIRPNEAYPKEEIKKIKNLLGE